MSETLIMDRYTVTSSEWTWNEQFGAWTAVTPRVCELVPGEYYAITNVANVSEVEFRFEATEACDVSSLIGMPMVAVGNLWSLGLPSNGSMYIIGDGGTYNMFVYTGASIDFQPPDHTFKVHQVVGESGEPEEPEEPDSPENPSASNNAVILSYSQTPIIYENIPKVWLTHPDSTEEDVKLVPFTYGEAVAKSVDVDFSGGDMAVDIPAGELVTALTVKKPEDLVPENIADGLYIAGVGPGAFRSGPETAETTVALDFSQGDMVVTPEPGEAFSRVDIPVPANLSPDNIAEGVNIAGVIGTLMAGGGGRAKVAYGTVTSQSGSYIELPVIEHNLGVIPDIIFVWRSQAAIAKKVTGWFLITGVSSAFAEKSGIIAQQLISANSQYFLTSTLSESYITGGVSLYTYIQSATSTTFKVGRTVASNTTYHWVAIGGLT